MTFHVWLTGASTFPCASVARTRNVCGPSSTVYSAGEAHGTNACVSSEHSKVAVESFETKWKLASSRVVSASGPFRIVVVGAVRSAATVHVQLAGVSSTLPAPSVARALNVCGPSARPV